MAKIIYMMFFTVTTNIAELINKSLIKYPIEYIQTYSE